MQIPIVSSEERLTAGGLGGSLECGDASLRPTYADELRLAEESDTAPIAGDLERPLLEGSWQGE